MPIQLDKFDPSKIDLLRESLEAAAKGGNAQPFEIFVDGLKAIRYTTDTNLFNGYEKYMNANTSTVKVVIYDSENTNRNEAYIFSLKAQNQEEAVEMGLSGLSFKPLSQRDVAAWRQRKQQKTIEGIEIQGLKREITELNGVVEQLETRNEELENQLEELGEKAGTINGLNIPDVLARAGKRLLKSTLEENPSLSGLAGLFGGGEKPIESAPANQESEASFTKQSTSETGTVLTEQEKQLLSFFKQMERFFSPAEMEQLITVIDLISKDKSQLPVVLELLQEEPGEEKQ